MERIPFDFTEFKQGAIAINSCGDEFTFVCCIGDKNIKIQDQERNYGVLSLEFAKNHWTMKPKEDDIWSDWISHDGSECPIPDVKAGDYEFKYDDGEYIKRAWSLDANDMASWGSVVAYRIKKHLLKPKNLVIHDTDPLTFGVSTGAAYIPTIPNLRKYAIGEVINKPYTPKDQYILNYVHEEPKGVLHEDDGMSRLLSRLMK